jgi:hypothetical protein
MSQNLLSEPVLNFLFNCALLFILSTWVMIIMKNRFQHPESRDCENLSTGTTVPEEVRDPGIGSPNYTIFIALYASYFYFLFMTEKVMAL